MRKIMALAVIGATLALAVPAHAEEQSTQTQPGRMGEHRAGGERAGERGGGHRGEMMKRLDTNGDGAVSKEEFLAGANERFSKMDRNGDGKLTQDDRPQRPEGGGPNGGQGGGDAPPEPPADGGGE